MNPMLCIVIALLAEDYMMNKGIMFHILTQEMYMIIKQGLCARFVIAFQISILHVIITCSL